MVNCRYWKILNFVENSRKAKISFRCKHLRLGIDYVTLSCGSQAVLPDCAIFERSWQKHFFQK